MSTFRDTISIAADGDIYQISNAIWQKNDYDTKGWHKLGTNERGAFHAYTAKLNKTDNMLHPVEFGVMNPIKVDIKAGKIILGETEYIKVR